MSEREQPIRVSVENDFPVVIEGLKSILRDQADFDVVERGADTDLLVVDTFGLGDDLVSYVLRTRARVVTFSAADDARAVEATFEKGVSGYVHKSASVAELVDALERVYAGERVVVRRADSGRRNALGTTDWPGRRDGLSDREAEVLALICQGLSNQQVAGALYLSVNSVKTYIRTLYRKINAQSRSQAVIWGLQHGFAGTGDDNGNG